MTNVGDCVRALHLTYGGNPHLKTGVVWQIDDLGLIHIDWDDTNRSSSALDPTTDYWETIPCPPTAASNK